MKRHLTIGLLLVPIGLGSQAEAGMPAVLPSGWTVENGPTEQHPPSENLSTHSQVQTLSFFVLAFLVGTKCLQWIWNAARKDFPFLPQLGYGRALSLTLLWGCLFVVVLTMISGARELMTPGAWRKSGWTYQLESNATQHDAESSRAAASSAFP